MYSANPRHCSKNFSCDVSAPLHEAHMKHPTYHGVVCDHFWGGRHGWMTASAPLKAPGSVETEALLGYLPSCGECVRNLQNTHHRFTTASEMRRVQVFVCFLACFKNKYQCDSVYFYFFLAELYWSSRTPWKSESLRWIQSALGLILLARHMIRLNITKKGHRQGKICKQAGLPDSSDSRLWYRPVRNPRLLLIPGSLHRAILLSFVCFHCHMDL